MATAKYYDVGGGKTYTTIAAAESASRGDCVTLDEIHWVRVFAKSGGAKDYTETVYWAVTTLAHTDATRYRGLIPGEAGITMKGLLGPGEIASNEMERYWHCGHAGAGDKMLFTAGGGIRPNTSWSKAVGFELNRLEWSGGTVAMVFFDANGSGEQSSPVIRNLSGEGASAGGVTPIQLKNLTAATGIFEGITLYNWASGSWTVGIDVGSSPISVQCCTIIDSDGTSRNAFQVGTPTTEDYNISSDASASGANSHINQTAANIFVSGTDLTPKSTGNAYDGGPTSLSGLTIDLDGTTRPSGTNLDIGAIEAVQAAGGGIVVLRRRREEN